MSNDQSLKIFIIILNWNGKKDTLECLSSIEKVRYDNFQTIVVDNGSSDDSVVKIKEAFPKIIIIETQENLGFAGGNNVGITYALEQGADCVLLLNNDTVVDPEIINAFIEGMRQHVGAGIFGGKIYLYDEKSKFDHFGGNWNPKKAAFDYIGSHQIDDGKSWETPQELDYGCGACLFIKKEVFEAIGYLEPKFFLIWEETDFCFRARKAGFASYFIPKAKLWHKVSASMVSKVHSTYFWWRNRLLWIERNCSKKERAPLYLKILLPDLLHIFKLRIIKTIQLQLLRLIKPQEELLRRREKVLKYKAALHGARDYALRRFGNGPAWIYKTRR